MKKIKIQLLSHKIAIAIIGVFAVGFSAFASINNVQNIENYYEASQGVGSAETPVNTADMENTADKEDRLAEICTELGAGVGPNNFWPYFNVNNFYEYRDSKKMLATSTMLCSFKSPKATSTLAFGSASFAVSSTSAMQITFAKSADAFTTTTIIGDPYSVTANTKDTILASTTPVAPTSGSTIFAPSTYFNVSVKGSPSDSVYYSPIGQCKAKFIAVE